MYWACMNINYIVFSYGTNYSNLSPGENWNFLFRKFVRNWSQIFYIYTEGNLNLSWRFSYTNFLGENCSFWPMNMHGCHNLWISDIHDMYISWYTCSHVGIRVEATLVLVCMRLLYIAATFEQRSPCIYIEAPSLYSCIHILYCSLAE